MRFITRNDILTQISDVIVTSFCVELYSDAAAVVDEADTIDVSNSVGITDVTSDVCAILVFSVCADCIVFDTFSVIAFIILYGLLLVPRNDLGKYWSSIDGEYSGAMDADVCEGSDASPLLLTSVVS